MSSLLCVAFEKKVPALMISTLTAKKSTLKLEEKMKENVIKLQRQKTTKGVQILNFFLLSNSQKDSENHFAVVLKQSQKTFFFLVV